MRKMRFAIFAKKPAIGINHSRSVVVDSRSINLVNGNDEHHSQSAGGLHHQLNRGTIGNLFRDVIPTHLLFRWKIRSIEKFLHAENLNTSSRGLFNERHVFIDHCRANGARIGTPVVGTGRLNESRFDDSWHRGGRFDYRMRLVAAHLSEIPSPRRFKDARVGHLAHINSTAISSATSFPSRVKKIRSSLRVMSPPF